MANENELGPLFASVQSAVSNNIDSLDVIFKRQSDPRWDVAESVSLAPRWNKLFPYQLMILERQNGKWIKPVDPAIPNPFTLPIPPQTLNIEMPFASTVEATQGGVIEQNNGAPFREISLSGSTGVLPLRGVTEKPQSFSIFKGLFAGTVTSASGLTQRVQQISNTVAGNPVVPNNIIPETDFQTTGPQSPAFSTGYYQFLLLKRFLEWYANIKKTRQGQNLTLGFAVWKEKEIYLVTPVRFGVSRSAGKALHYNYALQLKAWRRVTLSDTVVGTTINHGFAGRNPNAFATALNGIEAGRLVLENSRKVLESVRADATNIVLGTLRKLVLFGKDLAGMSLTVADLPYKLYEDFKDPLLEKIGVSNDPSTIFMSSGPIVSPEITEMLRKLKSLAQEKQKNKTQSGNSSFYLSLFNGETASPALSVFTNPELWYGFWSQIPVGSLNVRPVTNSKINDLRNEIKQLRRLDFENARDEILAFLADFESAVGLSDTTFSATFNLPERAKIRDATAEDFDVAFALSQVARHIDSMAASATIEPEYVSSLDIVAGMAEQIGIAFTRPASKYLVPFPYGYTLEQLAGKYLGDVDRWIEIAALNGLRTPYVDEVGFTQDILTNGSKNEISVTDASRYFVGQPIWIQGLGVKREKRRITAIKTLSPTLSIISLDGNADLDRFTVTGEAFVQAFLPGTVNSLQYIYIPSDEEIEDDWRTKSIPGVDSWDPMFRVGGADLMIDSNGDLVITQDGTTRLAVGLSNLIQRLRIGISTPRGSLQRHPDFGFGIIPGTSTAEVSATDILAAAKEFVKNEEGFNGVNYAAVEKRANGMTISMSVGIAGVNKNVPLTVELGLR